MLTEEALIVIAGLAACALVILGALELVAPTRRRRRPRRARPRSRVPIPPRAISTAPTAPPAPAPPGARATGAAPAGAEAAAAAAPGAAAARAGDAHGPGAAGAVPPAAGDTEPPIERLLREQAAPPAQAEPEEPARVAVESVAERSERLIDGRQFAAALREAGAALDLDEAAVPHADRLRLLAVVAAAQGALGDPEAARLAILHARALALPDEQEAWQRRAASVALAVAPRLLDRAGRLSDPVERVTTVRSAVEWLETVAAPAPGDPDLRQAAEAARTALWAACQAAVQALRQRYDFPAARRLLQEVLRDGACPPPVQAALRQAMAVTIAHEVAHWSAEGLERMEAGDGALALAALDRAEAVLASAPRDVLGPRRQRELVRRLWSAYTRLGARHLKAGRRDEALEPLLRALALQDAGPDRHDRARAHLGRALAGLLEDRRQLVERLAAAGDLPGAQAVFEMMRGIVETAVEHGVHAGDLQAVVQRAARAVDGRG